MAEILVGPISVNNNSADTNSGNISLDIAETKTINSFEKPQTFSGIYETKVDVANNILNLAIATYFKVYSTSNITLSCINPPLDGLVASFMLEIYSGDNTVTWWSNIKWSNGLKSIPSKNATDLFGFITYDGGLTWIGLILARDLKTP